MAMNNEILKPNKNNEIFCRKTTDTENDCLWSLPISLLRICIYIHSTPISLFFHHFIYWTFLIIEKILINILDLLYQRFLCIRCIRDYLADIRKHWNKAAFIAVVIRISTDFKCQCIARTYLLIFVSMIWQDITVTKQKVERCIEHSHWLCF